MSVWSLCWCHGNPDEHAKIVLASPSSLAGVSPLCSPYLPHSVFPHWTFFGYSFTDGYMDAMHVHTHLSKTYCGKLVADGRGELLELGIIPTVQFLLGWSNPSWDDLDGANEQQWCISINGSMALLCSPCHEPLLPLQLPKKKEARLLHINIIIPAVYISKGRVWWILQLHEGCRKRRQRKQGR